MKTKIKKINFHRFPDKFGRFGKFGGRFVAETLMPLLLEVESEYDALRAAYCDGCPASILTGDAQRRARTCGVTIVLKITQPFT